jgi:hypothetical protein
MMDIVALNNPMGGFVLEVEIIIEMMTLLVVPWKSPMRRGDGCDDR